jgi:hypothetical protein
VPCAWLCPAAKILDGIHELKMMEYVVEAERSLEEGWTTLEDEEHSCIGDL